MSVKVVCKSWKEKQPNWHPIIHRGLLGGNRNEGKKGENVCRNLSHGMERAWTISRGEIGKGSWEKEEAEITAKTGTEWTLLKSKGDEEKRKCGSAVRGQLAQWRKEGRQRSRLEDCALHTRQGADAGLEREETSKDMCGEIFEKEMKEVSYGRQMEMRH